MNQREFIEAIRKVVVYDGISAVEANLVKPPGRKPSEKLLEISNWYYALDDDGKSVLTKIVKESVETAVFGFLCLLDGVRQIENEDKGELKLYYEKGDVKILLNDSHRSALHEFL